MITARLLRDIRSGGFLLFLVIGLGLSLRLFHIDAPLASDELATTSIWAQMPFASIPANYQYPNNHIFLTLLVHVILKLFGTDPILLRLPVLISGTLSLLLGYAVTKRIAANSSVALGVMLLLAISANHIFYSTNTRGYLLTLLFAQLALYWILLVFYSSDSGTWSAPSQPIPLKDLFFLFTFCSLGAWTLPTFVLFEGVLLIFFCLLLIRRTEGKGKFKSSYAQVVLTLLLALAGFGIQYFVLIPKEMLKMAMTRAPLTPAGQFIPDILSQWIHPFEPAMLILVFLAVVGLLVLFQRQKTLFVLLLSLLLVPPVFLLLGHFAGALKNLPAPRVFLYLQPFFYMCVALGGYAVIAKVYAILSHRFQWSGSVFSLVPAIYFLCFLPLGILAGQELTQDVYPQRINREPFHEIHRFIQNSGLHDLFLASNQIHVEFFLYGAGEMRKRVESIIESGKLENIYFISSTLKGHADIELVEREGKRYYHLRDYIPIGPPDASAPLTLPAELLQKVMRAGNLALYRIAPERIHKVFSLTTPEELNAWEYQGAAQKLSMEPVQAQTGTHWGLRFSKNFKMVSPEIKPAESGAPVFTIKFLVTASADQPTGLYLNAALRDGVLNYQPMWLANAWTLDHPYGAQIYKRKWKPWIFISNTTPSHEVLHTQMPESSAPHFIWGLQSFRVLALNQ